NVIAPESAATYSAIYRAERDPRRLSISPPTSRPVTVSTVNSSGSEFGVVRDSLSTQRFGTWPYLSWSVEVISTSD
ncbi:MAG TPA: hypothetical protein VFY84_08130, partial [Jiangellales bacterium]|nr:hypothetical protein [Jiangellales bacterium]